MDNFSNTEVKMLIQLLEQLSEEQGNAGCNDLFLPLTKENKEFAEIFNKTVTEDNQLEIREKNIVGLDILVTHYFIKKLKENIN